MKTKNIKETFELAVQNHKEYNFEIAEKLYKEILNIDPNHFKSIIRINIFKNPETTRFRFLIES